MPTLKTYFLIAACIITSKIFCQKNFVTLDTTDKRIGYYKTTLQQNKTLVRFIEFSLIKYGLPKALRNVVLIESDFKNKMVSWANAIGIWQLTPALAAHYGLSDAGRYDVLKSTQVAAQLIADLYNNYKDWRLVLAAYNCGKGNVNKAIRKSGSNNYDILKNYLPNETVDYLKKFTMACYATDELCFLLPQTSQTTQSNIIISTINYGSTVAETEINAGFSLPIIAEQLQMDMCTLIQLNPIIEQNLYKNGTAKLILPIDKMPDFLLKKTEILIKSMDTKN